jgi:hypothetical protein
MLVIFYFIPLIDPSPRNKPTNGMLPHHLQHIVPVLIWPQDDASILRDYSTLQGNTLLKETLGHQNRQSSLVMVSVAT